MPERDSNRRNPDFMEGYLATRLPKQPPKQPQSEGPGSKCLKIDVYFVASVRLTSQWLHR